MINLSQSTAVITGATGGIGKAIAESLALSGCELILVGRNENSLSKLVAELTGHHKFIVADISMPEGRNQIHDVITQNTSINLLVQAAGVASFGEFIAQSDAHIEDTIHMNLTVPMLISRSSLPVLEARDHGCLVNIGSAFGSIGFAGFSSYSASKFGLRGFTEAVQREFADSDLEIKYFAPRATRTDFNTNTVANLNDRLGNTVDEPEVVAKEFMTLLTSTAQNKVVGWPEKFFCRLNGLFPELVSKALAKKRQTIMSFAKQNH